MARPQFWRDVDQRWRNFGLVLKARGVELYIGRRLYRAYWGR